jgi:hypothetical protein
VQSAAATTNVLTEAHRAAIAAAIPAGVTASPEFWHELEETIAGYRVFRARREHYDTDGERRKWRRLEKAVAALAPQLGEKLVLEFKRKAYAYAAWLDTAGAYRGTKNPDREFLYAGVLRGWTDHLGGKLQYSTSKKCPAYGPLVRFFVACVKPILGDDTPTSGIADIVDRERKERDRVEQHKRPNGAMTSKNLR